MRWRPRSKHPQSLPVGPSQASSLPWRTVGPSSHSAPENHDLIWSDRAEDAAKHSTHMAEQPVRRVLYAREAFPVKHEVLRAPHADSGARRFNSNAESGKRFAHRIEVSPRVLGPSTNDPEGGIIEIRCSINACHVHTVRTEARWSLPRQSQRKYQDASAYLATLTRAASSHKLHVLFMPHDGKAARAYNQRRHHDLAGDALTGRHFRPILTGFSRWRWSRRRRMAASACT